MSINWYPGHMHRARKEIIKTLSHIDVIIEIVDARLPYSSQNPVIAGLAHNKPTIIVFNKCDLADDDITTQWQLYYEKNRHIKTLTCQQDQPHNTQRIIALCHKLAPEKAQSFKAINAMIVGIPNVGKSTIINTLAGKVIAKTGNEPAVTKNQQKIQLEQHIILHDTPGILWPKIDNPNSGYRLAISGAIKNTAMEFDDVGFYAAEYFLEHYPKAVLERYSLNTLPQSVLEFLETMGAMRGAKQAGGRINLYKACEILLHEYRNGTLGMITLEKPDMLERELAEVELAKQEKERKKEQRKAKRKSSQQPPQSNQ